MHSYILAEVCDIKFRRSSNCFGTTFYMIYERYDFSWKQLIYLENRGTGTMADMQHEPPPL